MEPSRSPKNMNNLRMNQSCTNSIFSFTQAFKVLFKIVLTYTKKQWKMETERGKELKYTDSVTRLDEFLPHLAKF